MRSDVALSEKSGGPAMSCSLLETHKGGERSADPPLIAARLGRSFRL